MAQKVREQELYTDATKSPIQRGFLLTRVGRFYIPEMMLVYTVTQPRNSTKTSPVDFDILHLVKLMNRSSSLLVAHRQRGRSSSNPTESERISTDSKKFEQQDPRLFLVHCYKAISPYLTMHNDICSLALENEPCYPPYVSSLYRPCETVDL